MRPLLPLLALLLLPVAASLRAEPAPSAAAEPKDREEKGTELGDKMDAMRSVFRKLKKQISDASANASSLELVAKLRKASEESVALIPAKAERVPEADRAKFVAAYKKAMADFVAEVDKLKAALEAGKNEEAATILSKLDSLQKSGHRDFRQSRKD